MLSDSYQHRPLPVEVGKGPNDIRHRIAGLNQDVILGVAKAGACYPAILIFLALPLLSPEFSFLGFVFLLTSAIFAGFFGAIYALVCGSISMLIVHAFVATLNLKVRAVPYGAAIGGIAGFSSLALPLIAEAQPLSAGQIIFFFCGPVMAMVCGQIGGVIGATRFVSRFHLQGSSTRQRPQWQFEIRQLLVLTAWVCGALGTLKMFGLLDGPHAVFVLCFGGILQFATFQIGKIIVAACRRRPALGAHPTPANQLP